ncbi:hypothetical protein Tco_1179389, partial [Tanacetum coccineum]
LMQLLAKERYKVAKNEAKIAVAQAKDKAYEDLYRKLDSKEGANDIYKIAKARERKRMDIGNVRYIKDEGGRTIGALNIKCIMTATTRGFEDQPRRSEGCITEDGEKQSRRPRPDSYRSLEVPGRREGEVADVPLQQDLLRRKDVG